MHFELGCAANIPFEASIREYLFALKRIKQVLFACYVSKRINKYTCEMNKNGSEYSLECKNSLEVLQPFASKQIFWSEYSPVWENVRRIFAVNQIFASTCICFVSTWIFVCVFVRIFWSEYEANKWCLLWFCRGGIRAIPIKKLNSEI